VSVNSVIVSLCICWGVFSSASVGTSSRAKRGVVECINEIFLHALLDHIAYAW
jgi:hypothetical protein